MVWCVVTVLFPHSMHTLPISSLAGHSLVVRSPRWAGREGDECHSVFLTSQPGYSPEIFSRAGGHIYVAGLNSATEPLPVLASDAKKGVAVSAIQRLHETARELLLADCPDRGDGGEQEVTEDDLEVVREGLCFRPVTESGLPIIGRISDEILGVGIKTRPEQEGGVYIAAGHGPWGISLSLGTGKVLAEMMQGREMSADISGLGL
jgi:glycine/D-amino acid oxidase-like deaminating enzyme